MSSFSDYPFSNRWLQNRLPIVLSSQPWPGEGRSNGHILNKIMGKLAEMPHFRHIDLRRRTRWGIPLRLKIRCRKIRTLCGGAREKTGPA